MTVVRIEVTEVYRQDHSLHGYYVNGIVIATDGTIPWTVGGTYDNLRQIATNFNAVLLEHEPHEEQVEYRIFAKPGELYRSKPEQEGHPHFTREAPEITLRGLDILLHDEEVMAKARTIAENSQRDREALARRVV